MKRLLIIFAALIFFITSSTAVPPEPTASLIAKGNTNSELGEYFIEKAEPFEMIKGEPLPAYFIHYENSNDTVLVAIDKCDRKLTRYLVISENLVIEYKKDKDAFGASIIDDYFSREGFSTNVEDVDIKQYYHQRLISRSPKSETEYLQLISVFYPELTGMDIRIYTSGQN